LNQKKEHTMGLFGNSQYEALKKIVDDSATVAKGSMNPAGLLDVMAKQTEIAKAIAGAVESGAITRQQQQELLGTLMSKMGMGR
jgi:hypothetical protein